ncbi:small subunit ribosomal protein S20e [Nematocida parisii]|uniref:30S ribosomal protein S10p/S20e n=1 Tax=Nematocida parisii (strain ERTm3) TaxID=935791 RepID=I3EH94_NEMP3|nr:30S ribosomal protein S10p/S20e [Nematocida parisii ERTm1]EIJ88591.1 30S ribosomal protein S10p/S20e [Nematocida parisii ERTm3]KAI5130673.1 small subunit ribosomal protein S20e [Nematocida parisii]KAI5165172.1 small subunit ribosomal protein S20e [Nematocida sp. AWRm79]KAI5182332.1 small subunit ribosomal protein S20e [Nematocida sp. AWRm78]OAG30647.1 small subunit ribosomal protein S20e [Nematocida sp. ERTm5]|eukprot:XP_013058197.1 30S ribosomal protein S10p/S20e [Nematocida parisii ERTm1]
MHSEKDYEKEVEQNNEQEVQTLRVTMISRNKSEIERVAYAIYQMAKADNPSNKGPVSSKNNKLQVTVRKAPGGNGTNTYDKFAMTIRKKYIDITVPYESFKAITSTVLSPEVFIQVVIKA